MNKKLKEKCIEYISTNFTIDETMMEDVPLSDRQYVFWLDDVSKLAEHFYNLALADVRGEVERQYVYWDNVMISSASPNAVASKNRIKEILDFIDNLTK